MYTFFSTLRTYIKRHDVVIDHPIFRLNTKFTTAFLLTCSMIITWTQFVGQPISCMNSGSVPKKVINTYCWIMTTFTMPDAFNRPPASVAHPGVTNDHGEKGKHYTYYQWVCFVLFFQAMMSYFPRWLWKMWENRMMARIVCGLNLQLRTAEDLKQRKWTLIAFLNRPLNESY